MTETHTHGPWIAYRMVHEETNEPMTPEQVGEYVCNSVIKSARESGSVDFLIVQAQKADGPADVCHVGNGPTSPANARLIAAAPDLLVAVKEIARLRLATDEGSLRLRADRMWTICEEVIAKAEGR